MPQLYLSLRAYTIDPLNSPEVLYEMNGVEEIFVEENFTQVSNRRKESFSFRRIQMVMMSRVVEREFTAVMKSLLKFIPFFLYHYNKG